MTRDQKKKMVEEFLAKPENLTECFTELLSEDHIHPYVVGKVYPQPFIIRLNQTKGKSDKYTDY